MPKTDEQTEYERRCSFDQVALDTARTVEAILYRTEGTREQRLAKVHIAITDLLLDQVKPLAHPTPADAPAPQAEKAPAIDLAAYFEQVLSAAIEGAKVAEVCARLATEYGRRGDVQIANGHSAPAYRTSKAYEQHP